MLYTEQNIYGRHGQKMGPDAADIIEQSGWFDMVTFEDWFFCSIFPRLKNKQV
jgi:hypothetical protein